MQELLGGTGDFVAHGHGVLSGVAPPTSPCWDTCLERGGWLAEAAVRSTEAAGSRPFVAEKEEALWGSWHCTGQAVEAPEQKPVDSTVQAATEAAPSPFAALLLPPTTADCQLPCLTFAWASLLCSLIHSSCYSPREQRLEPSRALAQ